MYQGDDRRTDEHRHHDEDSATLRAWIGAGLLVLVVVLAFLSYVNQTDFNRQSQEQDALSIDTQYDMRLATFQGCVDNGNPFRAQVRREFIRLKEQGLIPVFKQVRQTVPPGTEVSIILDNAVGLLKRRIATIEERLPNVDCLESYPPLPGQTYPEDLVRKAEREAKRS